MAKIIEILDLRHFFFCPITNDFITVLRALGLHADLRQIAPCGSKVGRLLSEHPHNPVLQPDRLL